MAAAEEAGQRGDAAEAPKGPTHTPSEAMMMRALSPGGTSKVRMSGREMQARAQLRSPGEAKTGFAAIARTKNGEAGFGGSEKNESTGGAQGRSSQ